MSARSSARSERLRSMLQSSKKGTYVSKRATLLNEVEQRLNTKYNAAANPTACRIIREQVQKFGRAHASAKVTEDDLRKLEDSVRKFTVREAGVPKPAPKKVVQEQLGDEGLPRKPSTMDQVPDDTYHLFLESELVNHQKNLVAEQKEKRKKQREMKKILDGQMEEIKERKQREAEERKTLAAQLKQEAESFKKLEQDKQEAARQRYMKDKQLRDAQLKVRIRQKKVLEDRKKREDRERIEQCIRELEDERELEKLEKLEQKSYILKVQQANEEQKRLRALEKQKEWNEDKKRAEEYARRLAQEEAKRIEAFENMKAKSNQNQQMYVLQTQARKEQEELDARRALEYQKAKEANDLANEKKRIEKLKQDKVSMNMKLAEQVRKRHDDEEKERLMEAEYARLCEIRAKDAKKRYEDERQVHRNKMKEQRLALERQMKEKSLRKTEDPSKMSLREKKFNSKEIKQIVQNDGIVQTVKERIQIMEKVSNTQKKTLKKGPRRLDYYS